MTFVMPGRFVEPEVVSTHFFLKEGDRVADLGAGSGFFLRVLSQAVGSTGKVYACEIQKGLVEKLGEVARVQGLSNVSTLWCDLEEPHGIKIADGQLDAAILVNTLFLLENKAAALTEFRRILRPGGVLHVIDWTESFGGLGPQPNQVVVKDAAIALCEANQFMLEKEFPAGDHHYGFSVRKI